MVLRRFRGFSGGFQEFKGIFRFTSKYGTYATPAAGGMIYNLSVFFLARPYILTISNIFIPKSLGGHKLLIK